MVKLYNQKFSNVGWGKTGVMYGKRKGKEV